MMLKHTIQASALALMLAAVPVTFAAEPTKAPAAAKAKVFASPDAAAQALAEAVRTENADALLTIVGRSSRAWLSSGDRVADREDWKKFLAAYDHKHGIDQARDGRAFLIVGEDDWPFPAPMKKQGDGWVFDAAAGREEMLNRRIGRNELATMQTLLAIVDAQREYAAADPDRDGFHDYARKFRSSAGHKDGLYWPTQAGEAPSPLGELVAHASREGYGKQGKPAADAKPGAYHGYRYRLLEAQGPDANGGAYSYLVNKRLLGGFAVLAYPAKYGVSGVVSFVVNHEGVVYEKDLGPSTDKAALGMREFNPGPGWKKE